MQEMMLHETAVAWIRRGLICTLPAKPQKETVGDLLARMRKVVQKINEEWCDVDGLCRDLPAKLEPLCSADRGKLRK